MCFVCAEMFKSILFALVLLAVVSYSYEQTTQAPAAGTTVKPAAGTTAAPAGTTKKSGAMTVLPSAAVVPLAIVAFAFRA